MRRQHRLLHNVHGVQTVQVDISVVAHGLKGVITLKMTVLEHGHELIFGTVEFFGMLNVTQCSIGTIIVANEFEPTGFASLARVRNRILGY